MIWTQRNGISKVLFVSRVRLSISNHCNNRYTTVNCACDELKIAPSSCTTGLPNSSNWTIFFYLEKKIDCKARLRFLHDTCSVQNVITLHLVSGNKLLSGFLPNIPSVTELTMITPQSAYTMIFILGGLTSVR